MLKVGRVGRVEGEGLVIYVDRREARPCGKIHPIVKRPDRRGSNAPFGSAPSPEDSVGGEGGTMQISSLYPLPLALRFTAFQRRETSTSSQSAENILTYQRALACIPSRLPPWCPVSVPGVVSIQL